MCKHRVYFISILLLFCSLEQIFSQELNLDSYWLSMSSELDSILKEFEDEWSTINKETIPENKIDRAKSYFFFERYKSELKDNPNLVELIKHDRVTELSTVLLQHKIFFNSSANTLSSILNLCILYQSFKSIIFIISNFKTNTEIIGYRPKSEPLTYVSPALYSLELIETTGLILVNSYFQGTKLYGMVLVFDMMRPNSTRLDNDHLNKLAQRFLSDTSSNEKAMIASIIFRYDIFRNSILGNINSPNALTESFTEIQKYLTSNERAARQLTK